MTYSLAEMISLEPRLDDFARGAVQSARNGWYGWPEWFPEFGGFRCLVGPTACCEALRTRDAFRQAVTLLTDRRQVERGRIERQERQQRGKRQ